MSQKVETQTIATGIKELDSLFKGLEQNSIIVIGGKPEYDTTNFMLNLVTNLCTNGKRCLYCTLGFWQSEFVQRLAQKIFTKKELMEIIFADEVVTEKIFAKKSNKKYDKLKKYLNSTIKDLKIILEWDLEFYDLLYRDPDSVEAAIKSFHPDYVFIDTIEDITDNNKDDEEAILYFFKKMAEKYNTSFFITSLLRRDASEISPKVPTVSDLNLPKDLLEYSDDIILTYYYGYEAFRCRYNNGKAKRTIDIISAKRLNKIVSLNYDSDTGKMW